MEVPSIAAVRRLECFALRGPGEFKTLRGDGFFVVRRALCPADQLARAVDLWNGLPDAEPYRCHVPGIGLEFRDDPSLLLRAALCFECNNISFRSPKGEGMRNFDAKSAAARELLSLCKGVLGLGGP